MRLTANQKRAIRRMWAAGECSIEEIAEELSFFSYEWHRDGERVEVLVWTTETVLDVAKTLGLGKRKIVEAYIPTPEEVRLAAAKIRSQWTQREREERLKHAWLVSGTLDDATEADNDARGSATLDHEQGGADHRPAR